MDTVIAETVQYLSKCDGIHLSFDIDGIDPVSMPGVGTPVAGGISYEDSLRALQLLAELDAIISAEFVELNPLLDKDSRTTKAAMDLIAAFVGEKSRSDTAYHSDIWQPELTATIKG
ncbi:Arginase [bioreactor metagenome]|uniref:Arginase n=1 Tax=bioreactor metagenome TaxID=1076179 RepID=A0A645JP73_9ZZZZ